MRGTSEYFAQVGGRRARELRNVVRRVTIKASDAVRWLMHGFVAEDGRRERIYAEVFPNIGYAARPAAEADAEAIVVRPGAKANHTAVVATRDRAEERAVIDARGLEPGERIFYNATGGVKIEQDGTLIAYTNLVEIKLKPSGVVEIGAADGPFKAVALADHTHAFGPLQGFNGTPIQDGLGTPDLTTEGPNSVSQQVKVS